MRFALLPALAALFAAIFAPGVWAQKAATAYAPDDGANTRLMEAFRTLPLAFEKNRGQTDPKVRFLARNGSSTLFLTGNEAVLSLPHGSGPAQATAFLTMKWLGANPSAPSNGIGELAAKANYLIGADPAKWHNGIATYERVKYTGIYPGVDLIYYGDGGHLEYDLAVRAGADPAPIRMRFAETTKIEIDGSGDLLLKVGDSEVTFRKPVAYQTLGEKRSDVPVRFIRRGRHDIGFEAGDYDRTRPLIIDPQLSYSSYLGGSGPDGGWRIAVDGSGNAYIVGSSSSTDFPVVSPYQSANGGATNVVISKFNPEAAGALSLVYSTYLGGSGSSNGRAIALNSMGQIFVAGDTNSPDFPVTTGAYQTSCQLKAGVCSSDIFATKLDATGSTLLYSTYIGGTGSDFGFGVATDLSGHIFVGGSTGSANMPVTTGAFQTTFAGGGVSYGDAWVGELNPAGAGTADLLYGSFLGGSGSEALWSLAVDGNGAICVTGSTASANFPVTASAFKSTYSGDGNLEVGDAFVAKVNPAGQGSADLVYSTYLGGASDDRGEGIAVDSSNRLYVTGFTESAAFPVTSGTAFQTTFGGGTCNAAPCGDAFIAKLDPSLSGAASLVYSTFFGGSSFDLGHSIALDSTGLVYISGETASTNLPLMNPIQNACFGGCTPNPIDDVFIAKFNLDMAGASGLLFSTYLGGNDVDTGWAIGVDSKGDALVSGATYSTNFPTQIPFQAACDKCSPFSGSTPSSDAFLVKICITACPSPSPSPASLVFGSQNVGTTSAAQTVTFTNNGTGDLTVATIAVTGVNSAEFSQTNNCPSVLTPATYCVINVTFTPAAFGNGSANLSITSNGATSPQLVPLTANNLEAQTITFGALSNVNVGTSPFSISATASSGLTVGFSSTTPTVCTVSGSTVTVMAAGGCSIIASQAGNSTYAAASPVGQAFTVLFVDVSSSDYYYAAINVLAQYGITAGCGNNDYCPQESITRAQMAIFLVRTVYGSDNFTSSSTPYFTDVQPSDFGFKWIQKLFELGITAGCATNMYCPDNDVTRDEMAIFIIRARLGLYLAGSPPMFTYSTTPYFADVPSGDIAFPWIQRLQEENITGGCSGTGMEIDYCPSEPVIRGDMAIFIMRGGFNQFLPAGTPVITQVSPSVLALGTSGTYTITGTNTNFVQGTTQLSPIPGVSFGTLTVTNPTTLTVQLTAAANAVPQPYSILAITGSEQDVLPNGLVLQ